MNFDKTIPADHYSWLIMLKNIVIFNFPELMVLSTFTVCFFIGLTLLLSGNSSILYTLEYHLKISVTVSNYLFHLNSNCHFAEVLGQ